MKCVRCLHDNPPPAKFCEQCGAPLTRGCAGCGAQLSPSARFCPECGRPAVPPSADDRFVTPEAYTPRRLAEKILTSRGALEGERKQVTVLFADLKSSMELLVDRDPEEARSILDPVLELMMEAVHHYEGTVNQVMGDGIMALFGAPLAHEDHAVRACYAALRMQERAARLAEAMPQAETAPIRIRIGLNSGDVVVRSIANDLRMDYTAVGQTTHLAARMEQAADPGVILATAETIRLAEGYVHATALGRFSIRGLETPVDVYAITGRASVRSPLEVAAARGLTSLVGREAELAQLRRTVHAAVTAVGQVVGIVGEPGVGKSRLFHELTGAGDMAGWSILKAGAASYGKSTAYRPVIDLLRAYFEIHDQSDPRAVREKISTRVAALDTGLTPDVPALQALLDVPVEDPLWRSLDPRQRRHRTMDALIRLFLRASRERPLCLVLEDLHWIDSETQAFLDRLIESLPAARILLLLNYRPEYRPDWRTRSYCSELRVEPLPPQAAEQLLGELLGDEAPLAPLKQLLVERTQGNPFFLEESVRTLVEDQALVGERGRYRLATRIDTVRVPATVQAVLAARIDRLAAADKRLLQCASVIGEVVPGALVAAVADMSEPALHEALGRLCAAEFLHDVSPFPEREYVFRHGLTCQVAYTSLLLERRRALHARIVEAIEGLYADRLGERVERLAHHARHGELWDRAAGYLRQAGTKAFGHSANREAVVWFEEALRVQERLPATAATEATTVDLHLDLRNALTLLGEHERTLGHLRQAQAIAERLGDRYRLGRALSFEVNCLHLLGQHEQAIESARRVFAVADDLDDVRLKTVTEMYAGRAHLYIGDFAGAIEIFESIVATLTGGLAHDRLGIPILPSVFARSHLVECLAEVGRFDESARYANEAIALAESTNHPDTVLWAYHGAGVHHLARGDLAPATEALERAYAVCRRHDMPAYRPRISAEVGVAWAAGGRATDAISMVEQAAEEAAARHQITSLSKVLLLLAEVYFRANRPREAGDAAARALERFRRQRERGHEAHVLRLLGDIAAAADAADVKSAEAYYGAARALAERLGMHPLLARSDLSLARLLSRTGRSDLARQAFQAACAKLGELGMSADLARAAAELRAIS